MNAKNIPLKFAGVGILTVLCLWSLYTKGCQQGIDLQGGTSLIFEIRKPQAQIDRIDADLKTYEQELKQARAQGDETKIAGLENRIQQAQEQKKRLEGGPAGGGDLSERMISILKDRVDPQGLANLEWRPIGTDRIEVRMPAAKADTRQKRDAYEAAREAVEAGNVSDPQRRAYIQSAPAQREQMVRQFTDPKGPAPLTAEQVDALKALGKAYDAQQAAEGALAAAKAAGDPTKVAPAQAAYDTARAAFREADLRLAETAVRASRVESVLASYRTPDEEAQLKRKEKDELRKAFADQLAALKKEHAGREAQIGAMVAAYREWARVRHRLSDPSDLIRRVRQAGVLEFRIVAGQQGQQIDRSQRDRYVRLLETEGPEEVLRRGMAFAWFSVKASQAEPRSLSGLATAEYAGRTYVLLSNHRDHRMIRERLVGGWRLVSVDEGMDRYGRPAIDFSLDEAGASKFHALTSAHVGQRMAILLDDQFFSAPNIESAISSSGTITGRFTREELTDYIRLLEAGSLPAQLNPNPVSIQRFGPTLGAENRRQGVRAAYLGLICVAIFMLLYYRLPGLIANIALVLNLVLVLGVMSLLDAVFTLPGIAGVVLTIGIAVDANVLIFERLREEQAKGQTVRMALKNAYERAFSAIFDANITTLITCLILGWVGTPEVRGFAITLGLGVAFSLFTALVVTRWIFQLLLDANVIKSPIGMTAFIGTPEINWMAYRKQFWVLSGALIVLGIASLAGQGSSIWGIEFSSGTQAVLQFRDDALLGVDKDLPNDERVRTLFDAQAEADGNSVLRDARVETLLEENRAEDLLGKYDADGDGKIAAAEARQAGLSDAWFAKVDTGGDKSLDAAELGVLPATRYQVSTTAPELHVIQTVARKAFGRSLSRRTECTFVLAVNQEVPELGLTCDAEGKARIDVVADSPFRRTLDDFRGGVAVVVRNVTPRITEVDLAERIRDIRTQGRAGQSQMRTTKVLGLGERNEEGYEAFAVLVKLEERVPARWTTEANKEVEIVGQALAVEETMVARSFDPAIAGQAAQRAVIAIILSWVAIVLYLWLRFGSVQWGLAAVICLVHDVVIAVGLVAASGWLYNSFLGPLLGLGWFKIDLAMIAALLTVIGYSVNDTIVVFDRIRENRGKLTTVSVPVINKSINQTLARTLLTSGTTFIVVFIMYVSGGQGIHAFSFALLMGVIFGTYSSVAIASPLLMGFRDALVAKAVGTAKA